MSPASPSAAPFDHAGTRADYVEGLTALRGLAALWVVVYHAWVLSEPRLMILDLGIVRLDLTPLFSTGWAGVDVFFVLSAFLLGLPFARWAAGEGAAPGLRRYFWRRFLRIFPAYWCQFAILLLLGATLGLYRVPEATGLLTHAVLWLNLPPTWTSPILGIWWTLPTEFLFYLLLPPLALAFRPRYGMGLLVLVIAASVAYKILIFNGFITEGPGKVVLLTENTVGTLDLFTLGALAAHLQYRWPGRQLPPGTANALFLLGVSGMLLTAFTLHWVYEDYWAGHPLLFAKNGVFAIFVGALVVATYQGAPWARWLLHRRPLVAAGVISYSVYLWHFPILQAWMVTPWLARMTGYPMPWLLLAGLPCILAVAALSYRWVERPFLMSRRQGRS